MLERASTCLETGGRQLLKAPTRCLRSRRMLHSSFWHHGANDLSPPFWWASTPVLDHASGDVDDYEQSQPPTTDHDRPLLEFLYPEKTLALIRRLSTYGSDMSDPRRRPVKPGGVRQFSTSQWQPKEDQAVEDLAVVNAKEEMQRLLLETRVEQALAQLLSAKEDGKQELAWQLYSSVLDRDRTPQMQGDLLEYLEDGDMAKTAGRALKVFDAIPREGRRASAYRIGISAYVALKMVGPAIQLQEEAAARFDSIDLGTNAILKRTIQDDQWDLSLRVFRTFLQQADRQDLKVDSWHWRRRKKNFLAIWGQVAQLPDLVEHLHSFLGHVRQFQHELHSTAYSKRALGLFVAGFVPNVMDQVIHTPKPDEDYIWDFFVNLFRDIRSLQLPSSELFEHAISTMINTPRYRQYTNQRKIFLELYRQYHQQYLEGSADRPSRALISKLIVQHGEKQSLDRVNDMVADLRSFYPQQPFTPQSLLYLIRVHAKYGVVERVHEFLGELQSRFKDHVNIHALHSLIYAYARRVDVPGALHQFDRIQKEFNLTPDTACWNTLLSAYTRAEDLDGGLECFNNCLDSGVEPDIYTFGPMLDLCAARGDVEAFEALFARAKQLGVPVENDRRARTGYVQAFLNAGDAEGAETVVDGMIQSRRDGTLQGGVLTFAWNILISYYAVRGDISQSRRIYRKMNQQGTPLDSWTYASLMRSLVETKQTNAAYKILRVTMPKNNVRVYAFHYAIVITGFIRESQHDEAQRAYRRMQNRQVPQTDTSRQASLLSLGIAELTKLRDEKVNDPKARLIAVEEQLRQSILADYGTEIAHDQPSHQRYIDSPQVGNIPQGYFALVIMLYTTRGAYDICKQLFESASKAKFGQENYEAPIALLTAIMDTHLKAGEYAEVERCWHLARSEADRLVKTFAQVMNPEPPVPEFDSITDPTVKARYDSSRIATNRRQVLFRASRTYIRSLLAQGSENPQAIQQAQRTIRNLLTNGFTIDSLVWNEFIQHLALRGRIVDAFTACEMYLMPQFPGWAQLNPAYIRHHRPGYVYMEIRHFDVNKTTVLPKYRTLVILAAAYSQVKRDEANGLGYNPDFGGWAREVLEQIAPLTIRAVDTMPRTGDRLQMKYLGDS